MPAIACAWCMRPIAPKAQNLQIHARDGRFWFVHGTCLGDVVATVIDARAMRKALNRNENGPTKEELVEGAERVIATARKVLDEPKEWSSH